MMPPKSKEANVKKPALQAIRLPISESDLMQVPSNAVEGYQDRIEAELDWSLVEEAARHHKKLCMRTEIPRVTFTEALDIKIRKSILYGFIDKKSGLTLNQQWDLMLPIVLWDNEKLASDEEKICFESFNNFTDDIVKLIKRTVIQHHNRKLLKRELKMVSVLRLNDAQLTELDSGLAEYKQLVNLTLCGNFLSDIDASYIPREVRSLELQTNRIKNVNSFAEHLPADLLYLGLARNLITNDNLEGLSRLPHNLIVLDLSDNDIYYLEPLLDALAHLPNLTALHLAGNPCSVSAAYARTTLMRLPLLKWLDSREVLSTDRSIEPFEPHPDDLRSVYFNFTVIRIMSAPQPPKPEKGATSSFHVELELPLLDATRRAFLMLRRNESLTEMLPPPEDDEWAAIKISSMYSSKAVMACDMLYTRHKVVRFLYLHVYSKEKLLNENDECLQWNIDPKPEASSVDTDIYNHLVPNNSREIKHYTVFESNKIQWNKVMNFQEPAVRIFCPDLVALRNTFRTTITIRLVYTMMMTAKQGKSDKKSTHTFKPPGEQRVTLATIKCTLKRPDWTQNSQHFHWDDSLGTEKAIHWGEGDLSVLQYSQTPAKVVKGKPEAETGQPSRQIPPENLTCHFGFGITTLRA